MTDPSSISLISSIGNFMKMTHHCITFRNSSSASYNTMLDRQVSLPISNVFPIYFKGKKANQRQDDWWTLFCLNATTLIHFLQLTTEQSMTSSEIMRLWVLDFIQQAVLQNVILWEHKNGWGSRWDFSVWQILSSNMLSFHRYDYSTHVHHKYPDM